MPTTTDVQPRRTGRKRRWIVIGGVLAVLLALFVFFLPYLLKRYIEKHSVEWIDRKVTIDYLILNPLTFKYGIYGVKCYEPHGSDTVFVSWDAISVRSNLWKGFRENDWRFTHVLIRKPYFHLVQRKDRFNFTDLIELGGTDTVPSADTSTTRFSMEDIQLEDGTIDYVSDVLKAPVTVQRLNATSTRITSDDARMDFALDFGLASGGDVKGGFTIDTDRSLYTIDARLGRFALPQLLPYLQDFMHAKDLKGLVDLDLDLRDSWVDTTALAVSARLDMQDLAIADANGEPLLGLKKGLVQLDTLNAKDKRFKLSQVLVDGLDTRYRMWADGSNTWTKALILDRTDTGDGSVKLAASESNVFVMLADYIKMLGQDFVANQYTADSMVFANGHVRFEDFTPEKPFRYDLSRLDVRSSRISTAQGTADFSVSALLNDRGKLKSLFRFDPKNFGNVQAEMLVDDLALQDLDPYSRWYAAYPLQQGVLVYTGKTTIQEGKLDSENHLLVDRLKFGRKTDVHDTGIFVLPLRLAAGLLKDVNGHIDLDIPVKGDLKDPSFKVWPIVWQVLKNLVVKAGAAPVRLIAGAFKDVDEKDLESVRFGPTQATVDKPQQKALDMLVKLLEERPAFTVDLVPLMDKQQTEEEWAAFAVKKRYLRLDGELKNKDSTKVAELSLRDEEFLKWLDEQSPGTKGRPERARCLALVGVDAVRKAIAVQEEARKNAVAAYLKEAKVDAKRYRFRAGTKEELAGFTGDPGYRFVFDTGD
ncbi:MAG: DUF748 domain-containing protein [Flavobacteriales bacterium]